MLWTDDKSRAFIAEHYPWFLDTFNDYPYAIQRADAIRYFILYHYGGVYLDLDIGCTRPLDPLLVHPVILPKTIPVGVSNDLMFAEKGHDFLAQTIHNLVTFDHSWILNYPTVMFSTGPMFLSAQYGIYQSSHASTPGEPIRILPKAFYGKNAKEGEAPHSFFSHFYGSSWHADDAAFIGFLGTWGRMLMWIGLFVLVLGTVRTILPGKPRRYSLRRMGRYDVLFPRWSHRTGRLHLHLGRSTLTSESSEASTSPPSPDMSVPGSPVDPDVYLPFEMPGSRSPRDAAPVDQFAGRVSSPIVQAFRRVRNRVTSSIAGPLEDPPDTPGRSRRHYNRVFYLPAILPAIFTPPQDIEMGSSAGTHSRGRPDAPPFPLPPPRSRRGAPEKYRYSDVENADPYLDAVGYQQGVTDSQSTLVSEQDAPQLIDFGEGGDPPACMARSRSSSYHEDP